MKTMAQIKNQAWAIEKMMYKDEFFSHPKNKKRLERFHVLCNRIEKNLLEHFGIERLCDVERKRANTELIPREIYQK